MVTSATVRLIEGVRLIQVSLYYVSIMTKRLSGNISVLGLVLIVLKSLLGTARQ